MIAFMTTALTRQTSSTYHPLMYPGTLYRFFFTSHVPPTFSIHVSLNHLPNSVVEFIVQSLPMDSLNSYAVTPLNDDRYTESNSDMSMQDFRTNNTAFSAASRCT